MCQDRLRHRPCLVHSLPGPWRLDSGYFTSPGVVLSVTQPSSSLGIQFRSTARRSRNVPLAILRSFPPCTLEHHQDFLYQKLDSDIACSFTVSGFGTPPHCSHLIISLLRHVWFSAMLCSSRTPHPCPLPHVVHPFCLTFEESSSSRVFFVYVLMWSLLSDNV